MESPSSLIIKQSDTISSLSEDLCWDLTSFMCVNPHSQAALVAGMVRMRSKKFNTYGYSFLNLLLTCSYVVSDDTRKASSTAVFMHKDTSATMDPCFWNFKLTLWRTVRISWRNSAIVIISCDLSSFKNPIAFAMPYDFSLEAASCSKWSRKAGYPSRKCSSALSMCPTHLVPPARVGSLMFMLRHLYALVLLRGLFRYM